MIFVRLPIVALCAAFLLSACADTSEAPISRAVTARYVSEGPAYVEVMTMVKTSTGFGEHIGIIISGSQTVLYDPAGTFRHPDLPRRQDVFYGVTPRMASYYKRFHARFKYHVEVQRVSMSVAEADELIAIAEARRATPKLFCARAASDVLNDVPTFAHVNVSFYPDNIRNAVARIPGVETTEVHETDVGKNHVDAVGT